MRHKPTIDFFKILLTPWVIMAVITLVQKIKFMLIASPSAAWFIAETMGYLIVGVLFGFMFTVSSETFRSRKMLALFFLQFLLPIGIWFLRIPEIYLNVTKIHDYTIRLLMGTYAYFICKSIKNNVSNKIRIDAINDNKKDGIL